MNSRMNSGRGFQIRENDVLMRDPWVPLTPGKPIMPVSNGNGVPIDRHGNLLGRTSFQDLIGVSDRHVQQTMRYGGIGENFDLIGLMGQNGNSYDLGFQRTEKGDSNHNIGSYTWSFGNERAVGYNNPLAEVFANKNVASVASANGTSSRSMDTGNALPTVLNSYSQVDSSWTEGNFTSLLLGSESPGSNHWIQAERLPQMPSDGFPVPFRPNYNLNSPPRLEADATSSTTNSFPFAPVTPDHGKQFENHRHSGMVNFSESSSQEKDKLEPLLACSEAVDNHCNELLRSIVDSSSAAVSTSLTEKDNFEEGGDLCIDLNKTPQLKQPKRRKHRPKVIVEGKPKRTPKPKHPNTNPKENPSGKRKYVRKKGLEATATQQTVVTNEVTAPTFESKEKSCRRKLNFDLETDKKGESQGKAANLQSKMHQDNRAAFNLNLDSQATESCTGINSVGAESAEIRLQNGYTEWCQQAGSTSTVIHSMNQMPAERISLPERFAPSALSAAIKHNNLNFIARSVNMRNGSSYRISDKNSDSGKHQHLQGELNRNVSLQTNTHRNLEETRQMTWQNIPNIVRRNVDNSNDKRGLKQEYLKRIKPAGFVAYSQMASPFMCRGMYQVDDNSHYYSTNCSETQKRKRMGNGFHTTLCSTQGVRVVNDGLRQVATQGRNSICANSSTFHDRIPDSYFGVEKTSNKLMNGVNSTCGNGWSHFMTTEHNTKMQIRASELHSNTQSITQKRLGGLTQAHNITSVIVMANSHLLSSTPPKKAPTSFGEQGVENSPANMSVEGHCMAPTSSKLVSSSINKVHLQERRDASHDYQRSSMETRGQPGKQQSWDAIYEITCRLQGLKITGWSKETNMQEQNAIVPYKGDSTMVPYEGFDLIKKRKPRPKVDLDPETNRIWKLLMGKEGSEATEAEDKDKQKWWEDERKVFRGRADSFIARMHLVQGDRRFSQWKGSVVDSVIGVFLTQNVSDHLSSSAFMSLAARFPVRSKTTEAACYESGAGVSSKEPDIRLLFPNGTIKYYEKIATPPIYKQVSAIHHESSESRRGNPTSGTGRTILATEHNGIGEEKASASQNVCDFFGLQVNKGAHSCTGSNSEAEDSTHRCKPNMMQGPPTHLHMRRTDPFQVLHGPATQSLQFDDRSTCLHKQSEDTNPNWQIPGFDKLNNLKNSATLTHPINSNILKKQGPNVRPSHFPLHIAPDLTAQGIGRFGLLTEESISSLPSTTSGYIKGKGTNNTSGRIGHTAERISETIVQQNGGPMIQAQTIVPSSFPSKHLTQRESRLMSVPHPGEGHFFLSTHQQERPGTFQSESTLAKEPARPTEIVATRQSGTRDQVPDDPAYRGEAFGVEKRISVGDKQKFPETKAVEANAKDRLYFSGETAPGMSTNLSNARRKAEDEKRNSCDWDSLRRLVEPNGRRKERSKEAMDSLDYEALRQADVSEISNAIKERGMNNMLAERIQDFLNRLVREHGSIDLEWLRDVPPDKAKDYLLSVWGLGLKSVECVRLLTLHHLAFPVDTNVGRIAVRLGWVPLQPLPESLQLHLLELYPMLETIQKYLWPRLCKLDQRTLYELHYQMITFGKVFCTKSKPNCNACPMRGECRHFASAFASARLALPGPEDRSVVSSTIPIATDKSPTAAIKPMPLLPAGSSETKEIGLVLRNCEPIVEEPATPESTEVTETDIEDAFYEDPEEIPTIKLNLEEFTLNLHNYMQENMELQEIDMSKALVALNPQAASIPTPKLKDVSRLRTEHQVYELPDTHPLLKGLDKREPDDPSPYLLAIWTPGETANSVQPPERRCGSQESGKLCNEETCFSCSSMRETNAQTVRGTLLIPCRTAMRGSFPLNGTYFQVNEVFADHESSLKPIDVPRAWIWNLPRRTVYFGTSVSTIFKGLTTEGIQYCFWRGFVCVRGFDHRTRAPRPLMARLHFPASKLAKTKNEDK